MHHDISLNAQVCLLGTAGQESLGLHDKILILLCWQLGNATASTGDLLFCQSLHGVDWAFKLSDIKSVKEREWELITWERSSVNLIKSGINIKSDLLRYLERTLKSNSYLNCVGWQIKGKTWTFIPTARASRGVLCGVQGIVLAMSDHL